jgi:pyruvate dehydrogenase E1 component alpha subunit
MSDTNRDAVAQEPSRQDSFLSTNRRTFFKSVAGAGAAVSLLTKGAWAQEIGFWAKDLPNEKLIQMYTDIVRIRWHERTMVDKMITDTKYRGYNHFYAGQEAVAVGVCAALNNKGSFDQVDLVYSSHRPTGHAIAKGVDMKKMAAENDFRATGLNGGYGGEMHLSDKSCGFIGADGMIGPGHVIASGSAFAFKARGSKQVAVVFAGDGTYATPHFHAALNNAAMLKLPFIYVLENNLYHQYAHYSYSCPMKDIADAAGTYRIPGGVVDGQDVFQVYNVAKTAVDRARAGEGPTLIEAKTYRLWGHMMGDPEVYRTREEVAQARENEPIVRLGGRLRQLGCGQADLARFDGRDLPSGDEVALMVNGLGGTPITELYLLYGIAHK